jgi:hypothetical protein
MDSKKQNKMKVVKNKEENKQKPSPQETSNVNVTNETEEIKVGSSTILTTSDSSIHIEEIVSKIKLLFDEVELLRGKAIVTVDNAEKIDEAKECLKDVIIEISGIKFKK